MSHTLSPQELTNRSGFILRKGGQSSRATEWGRGAYCPKAPRSTALITLNASKPHTVRLEVTSHNKLLEPQNALLAPLVGGGLIFPACPRASTISYRSCILVLKNL